MTEADIGVMRLQTGTLGLLGATWSSGVAERGSSVGSRQSVEIFYGSLGHYYTIRSTSQLGRTGSLLAAALGNAAPRHLSGLPTHQATRPSPTLRLWSIPWHWPFSLPTTKSFLRNPTHGLRPRQTQAVVF